jgi:hypothetical protein
MDNMLDDIDVEGLLSKEEYNETLSQVTEEIDHINMQKYGRYSTSSHKSVYTNFTNI